MTTPLILPRLRSPIVLVHGLFGFDQVKVGNWTVLSYFPGIPEFLASAGNRVLVPQLSPIHGVAERARQLKAFLDRNSPDEPVHLIAHSMGGLDSRYMISRLAGAERVLTLTTIATPHRGTAFADWGIHRFERILKPVFDLFCLPRQGIYDVTTAKCRAFNEQVPDAPGVRYFSVAGRHEGEWSRPEWFLSHQIVLQAEGPNDGVVSVTSANYGESMETWDGNHMSLINWPNPISASRDLGNRSGEFAGLIRRLADEGY